MIINVKNKDTLIIDEFKFKCCIGKGGFTNKKIEGDKKTPRGTFSLGKVFFRSDRIDKIQTKLVTKKIRENLGWSDNILSKNYNIEITLSNIEKGERLYRKDHKYDIFIEIKYNSEKIKPGKGSAIFLHLTKNYKPTAGCVAIDYNSMIIILKLINKKTKIRLN